MRTLIFAAGLGTRLKPITDTLPKALAPVGGRPLIDIVMSRLQNAGCDDFVVNVHYFADKVKSWVSENSDRFGHIVVSDESDELLETGGGLRKAAPLLMAGGNRQFLIHNVDILSNLDVEALLKRVRPGVLATLVVSERESGNYLLFNDEMRLVGWTNSRTGLISTPHRGLDVSRCRKLAFSGIHVLSTEVFSVMDGMDRDAQSYPLYKWYENKPSEITVVEGKAFERRFSIIDFYLKAAARYEIVGDPVRDLQFVDVGTPEALEKAADFLESI